MNHPGRASGLRWESGIEHLSRLQNLRRYPFEPYQKQCFAMVDFKPDANSPGKLDILMAKR